MSGERVALISDIHGNGVALDAVLADIRKHRVREIVCLGDVAAGGPQPRAAIERLMALGCPAVRGNADQWLLDGLPEEPESEDFRRLKAIVGWGRRQLESIHLEFLRALPPTLELGLGRGGKILCFHGSPTASTDRVLATTPDEELDALFAWTSAEVLAGGHTHLQMLRRYRRSLLVNPGSVGLPLGAGAEPHSLRVHGPRVPRWAEYALVEPGAPTMSVELRRVPVAVRAPQDAARLSRMPYPDWWAAGLERRVARMNEQASRRR